MASGAYICCPFSLVDVDISYFSQSAKLKALLFFILSILCCATTSSPHSTLFTYKGQEHEYENTAHTVTKGWLT